MRKGSVAFIAIAVDGSYGKIAALLPRVDGGIVELTALYSLCQDVSRVRGVNRCMLRTVNDIIDLRGMLSTIDRGLPAEVYGMVGQPFGLQGRGLGRRDGIEPRHGRLQGRSSIIAFL